MFGLNSSLNHDSIVEETASKNILEETVTNIWLGDGRSLFPPGRIATLEKGLFVKNCYLGQISLRGKYGKLQSHLMDGLWAE